MISRYTHHGLTWVDLETPTREEILHLTEEFGLSKIIEPGLFSATNDLKVDLYNNFIYLILSFPQEIKCIIGKNFLVTIRYESIEAVSEFISLFENGQLFDDHKKISTPDAVLTEMIKQLYKKSSKELAGIAASISEIKNALFKGKEKIMIKNISTTSNALLILKEIFSSHKDIWRSYEIVSKHFFGGENEYLSSFIALECSKITVKIDTYEDSLKELRHTNNSLLLAKSKWL